MAWTHIVADAIIGTIVALLAFLGRSAIKGIESTGIQEREEIKTKIALSEKDTKAAFIRIDEMRKDIEMLKASYWSKEEQKEHRREMLDNFMALNLKLDQIHLQLSEISGKNRG